MLRFSCGDLPPESVTPKTPRKRCPVNWGQTRRGGEIVAGRFRAFVEEIVRPAASRSRCTVRCLIRTRSKWIESLSSSARPKSSHAPISSCRLSVEPEGLSVSLGQVGPAVTTSEAVAYALFGGTAVAAWLQRDPKTSPVRNESDNIVRSGLLPNENCFAMAVPLQIRNTLGKLIFEQIR
jgi:hypothetical protein